MEEENFFGKTSQQEPGPERLTRTFAKNPLTRVKIMNWQIGASGYAAVWATENTREAIFDAMKRRETYATTGPRMVVRLFGGWDFEPADANNRLPAAIGYAKGVPMGGDLRTAPKGTSPTFIAAALKDAIGANLDRIQIIKGWVDKHGKTQERIFDVAVSGGRKIEADGRCKTAVGTTVDVVNASWTNTIGAPELITVWKDPDFNPALRAFYYVRVLEIPTPRWTAYDAKRFGTKPLPGTTMTLQERAYTSPMLAAQVAVAGSFVDHPAAQHVALAVLIGRFPQGAPAAHIAPARFQRQHRPPIRFLHHRHVEGHIRAAGEGFPLQPQEIEVGAVLFQRGAAGAHHLRGQPLQLRQDGTGLEQEHAAVPGEAARCQKRLGGGPIRLLNKAGDRHRCAGPGQGLLGFDVAIAGLRRAGHDPEGHQLPRLGRRHARRHCLTEGRGVADHVVGRQHQQQWILPLGRGLQGRHRHRWTGVAADGLQQDAGELNADLAHLLGHDEAVVLVADQQRRRKPGQTLQALLGLLQQGFFAIAGQGPVLLGVAGPRQRPKPRACAAAQDHRNKTCHRSGVEASAGVIPAVEWAIWLK
jgi:hypothetical protein